MCNKNQSVIKPEDTTIQEWELSYVFTYIINYHRFIYMDTCNKIINKKEKEKKDLITQQMHAKYLCQLNKIYNNFSKIIYIEDYVWFIYCKGINRLTDNVKYCENCIKINMFDFNEADFYTKCGHYYCQKCLYCLCYNSTPTIGCYKINNNYMCYICNKKIKKIKMIGYFYEY